MNQQTCRRCGRVVPSYYISRGLCDCCKWDTWIPRGFEAREKYVMSKAWGHPNATRRPALGVAFLDDRRLAAGDLLAMCSHAPQSGAWVHGD